jgi:TonB family protein
MRGYFYLSILLIVVCLNVGAGQSQTKPRWTSITSAKGDLSFSLPGDVLVSNNRSRREITVMASYGDASFEISMKEERLPGVYLAALRETAALNASAVSQYVVDKFYIDVFTYDKKIYRVLMYLTSPQGFYTVTLSSKTADDRVVKSFLESIAPNGKSLAKNPGSIPVTTVALEAKSLKTSQLITDALQHKQTAAVEIDLGPVSEKDIDLDVLYAHPLLILRKDRPSYTDQARNAHIQGTIVLEVLLKADGDIGKIAVVKGLGGGLSKEAVEAAKTIKFLPATIGGRLVDVTRKIEYSFTIY